MNFGGQELPQLCRGARDRVRLGDAEGVKAVRAGRLRERGLRRRRRQKSRLA
jgi:hypothetical protein